MIHTVVRTPDDQERYDIHKQYILKNWVTQADMILHTVFGIQYDIDNSGKMYVNRDKVPHDVELKLTLNDFPYSIYSDMKHYVLWRLNGDITDDDILKSMTDISKKDNIIDYIYWKNLLHKRSIPEIEHIHIIALIQKS
jgi:hypothetical protein